MRETTLPSPEPVRASTTPAPSAAYAVPAVLAAFGIIVGTLLMGIVGRQGWVQPYTLDDPYIHLSVARTILAGGYGINPGDIQAPASSILWPFLLAPFALLPDQAFALVPLGLNIVLGAAVCVQLAHLAGEVTPERFASRNTLAALAIGLMLATNLPGLVFTGMEHVLQLLVTVMIVRELIRVDDGRAPGRSLVWLIAVAPLVRYELLALTGPAVLLLGFRGHRRTAALAAVASAVPLLAFSGFLMSHGLGALPSSVVSKAPGGSASFEQQLANNLSTFPAPFLLGSSALLLASTLLPGQPRSLPLVVASVALGHTALGRLDVMQRYAPYAVLVALAGLLYETLRILRHEPLGGRIPSWSWPSMAAVSVLPLALALSARALLIPIAAENIYLQHYQMARLAVDHIDRPVAVNDLGLVSFLDDDPAVDLWGLGSHDGLEARLTGPEGYGRWVEEEVRRRGVALAMVYSRWIGDALPEDWTPLASIELDRVVSAGSPVVTFFLTDPTRRAALLDALSAFERKVHPRAGFEWSTEVR